MVNDPAGLAEADLGLLRMAVAKALLERETAEELMRELRSSTSVDLEHLLITRGLLTAHSITMLRRDLTRSDGRTIGGFRLLTNWSAMPGHNRAYGDGHVSWTPRTELAVERMLAFDQTLPGGGGGGTFTWY